MNYEGLNCPMPIIKLKIALKKVTSGQIVKMTANDPGCPEDMKAFVRKSGDELIQTETVNGVHTFYLKKA